MSSEVSDDFAKTILEKFRQISKEQEEASKFSPNDSAKTPDSGNNLKRHFDKTFGKGELTPGIKEVDVGITQYINKDNGFSGIIKHRFSDFQVNEIDLDGNIVVLNSTEIPKEMLDINLEPIEVNMSVITPEEWRLINEISESKNSTDSLLIDVTEKSKEDRGCIHKAVKSMYGTKIVSNTITKDDKKYIEISRRTKPEARCEWASGRGEYLHMTMHKVNMDMTEVVHFLADRLKMKASLIGYGGTKDKRAKTTQRMSIKKRTAETLAGVRLPKNLVFGNYQYKDKELRLGDIKGNRFKIAIRNVEASDEVINKTLEGLNENGFINYFGLQRFGFAMSPTYVVGKALLANDWKKAVELLLTPRSFMRKQKDLFTACKKWFATRDAEAAAKCLAKFNNSIEAKILKTLRTHGDNAFMNALMALPRNTMTMYMHSYQSIIWNKIVSKRIEKFGLKPLPGDLVIDDQSVPNDDDDIVEGVINEDSNDEEDADNLSQQTDNMHKRERKSNVKVKALTIEECENCSMKDVVYPLPGYDIKYPDNEIARWYCEILAKDNFKMTDFNKVHKHFSLSGAYRHMLAQTDNLKWEIVNYSSREDDIILSDVDIMNNRKLTKSSDYEGNNFKAVVMEFCLKPSSYATMALREMMKCDTSSYNQAKLTNSHHCGKKKQKLDGDKSSSVTTVKGDPQSGKLKPKAERSPLPQPLSLPCDFLYRPIKPEPLSPLKCDPCLDEVPVAALTTPDIKIKLEPGSPTKSEGPLPSRQSPLSPLFGTVKVEFESPKDKSKKPRCSPSPPSSAPSVSPPANASVSLCPTIKPPQTLFSSIHDHPPALVVVKPEPLSPQKSPPLSVNVKSEPMSP